MLAWIGVASRRVVTRKERDSVWSQGGQVTNLDLQKAHGLPNMVYGLDHSDKSIALPSPHHETADQP